MDFKITYTDQEKRFMDNYYDKLNEEDLTWLLESTEFSLEARSRKKLLILISYLKFGIDKCLTVKFFSKGKSKSKARAAAGQERWHVHIYSPLYPSREIYSLRCTTDDTEYFRKASGEYFYKYFQKLNLPSVFYKELTTRILNSPEWKKAP